MRLVLGKLGWVCRIKVSIAPSYLRTQHHNVVTQSTRPVCRRRVAIITKRTRIELSSFSLLVLVIWRGPSGVSMRKNPSFLNGIDDVIYSRKDGANNHGRTERTVINTVTGRNHKRCEAGQ